MKLQIKIISIIITALLVLTFIPTIASPISKVNNGNLLFQKDNFNNEKYNTVKIRILHIKEDGTYERSIKTLTIEQQKSLWEKLKNIDEADLSLLEIFENKFQVLKDFEIVPSDLKLEQVVDVNKLENRWNKINNEPFEADYAPITFFGGGIGFGFGIPFFITSGTFLLAIFGLGFILCADYLTGNLYNMGVFFFPICVGYLGGYVGLLLLPVVPGFFYSNFFGMGFVTKTSWSYIPQLNYSTI